MKKILRSLLLILTVGSAISTTAQRNIAEAAITYDMEIFTGRDVLTGASTVYLKGNSSRLDMLSPSGKEITIYNSKMDSAVILKEFSGQRLMITLSKENWRSRNKMNGTINFQLTNEYKTIAGYNSRKAIASMPDGKTFTVYYSPDLIPANKNYDATFAALPGLPVQYEIESGKMKFKYTIAKINYDPVQVSMFDFPTSGYRVMSYLENQNLKKGN